MKMCSGKWSLFLCVDGSKSASDVPLYRVLVANLLADLLLKLEAAAAVDRCVMEAMSVTVLTVASKIMVVTEGFVVGPLSFGQPDVFVALLYVVLCDRGRPAL